MSKDIIWFAENIWGVKLTELQKEILCTFQNSKDKGEKVFLSYGRMQGIGLLKNILYGFEMWLKDQRIAELEEQLANSIRPKFKIGQEVWYAYSKIQLAPVQVIISDFSYYGYRKHKILYDSENYYEGMPEYCLFATKEEAQAKLEELKTDKSV